MMHKWYLLGILSALLLLSVYIVCKTLRCRKLHAVYLGIFLASFVAVAYYHWGGWQGWFNYLQRQAVLEAFKDPDKLIYALKSRLKDNPNSAQGWYLLGRVYASNQRVKEACDAYAKAQQLAPTDPKIKLNYAQSLWQLNSQSPAAKRLHNHID